MTASPADIRDLLARFTGPDLTQTLARIESAVRGVTAEGCASFLESAGAGREALAAAAEMKRLAGQINVTIHALGILLCLPHILEPDERVEYVSLGAGNTGRDFDLETNLRVAEFKFIRWRGGAESIRQNSVFKDYLLLAEHATEKRKHLYLLGTEHALRFLRGGRALSSVLSRNDKLQKMFADRFGETFRTVGDYYAAHASAVKIEDVSPWLSELAEELIAEPEAMRKIKSITSRAASKETMPCRGCCAARAWRRPPLQRDAVLILQQKTKPSAIRALRRIR